MTMSIPMDQASLRWNSTGPSLLRARIRVLTCGMIRVIVRRRNRAAMAVTRSLREANHLVIARHHVLGRDTVLHRAQTVVVHLHPVVEVREAVAVMNQGPLAPSSVSFVRQR